jgi:hypothetical protein
MKSPYNVAIALLLAGLAACAAGSDASSQAAQSGSVSELLLGFWHGFIAPVTLLGEIANEVAPALLPWTFQLYEAQGTGVLYDVGFFVGLLAVPSFLSAGASRRLRVMR